MPSQIVSCVNCGAKVSSSQAKCPICGKNTARRPSNATSGVMKSVTAYNDGGGGPGGIGGGNDGNASSRRNTL
ncbi:hypothetical protein QBC35DRAFT_454848 [Podospora australis]|uniref:Zinc-ribbon domain-containing protein n=1 Tax=Podospora australis TaxID=1536484 RepID=A0AAN6WR37_9PEZI|nr:hypothetical protein QBC35DRAFT_454848 [Podospora australis]